MLLVILAVLVIVVPSAAHDARVDATTGVGGTAQLSPAPRSRSRGPPVDLALSSSLNGEASPKGPCTIRPQPSDPRRPRELQKPRTYTTQWFPNAPPSGPNT